MNYSLSSEVEKLIQNESSLPVSIASRLREICPQHPDPEPYPDGTYGEYCEISGECLTAFLAFHQKVISLGHPGVSPGRGQTSLGVQFINPDASDDYLVIDFQADGSIQAIEKLADTTNHYRFASGTNFLDKRLLLNLNYFVKMDTSRIQAQAEYNSQEFTI